MLYVALVESGSPRYAPGDLPAVEAVGRHPDEAIFYWAASAHRRANLLYPLLAVRILAGRSRDHLASTAFLAISDLLSAESALALAGPPARPPRRPSSTAFAFFTKKRLPRKRSSMSKKVLFPIGIAMISLTLTGTHGTFTPMARKHSYDYVTWEEDGMWASHAPSVPGVYGLGDTAREAEVDLEEAMEAMSQYLAEVGEALPSPRGVRTGHLRA